MENFEVSQRDTGLHIEGFPDAVKVVHIDCPDAVRLSDLALHKKDLEFADRCLEAINTVSEEPDVLREALWRSAIVHFMKCFGGSKARFRMTTDDVLRGDPPEAMDAFKYFKSLRDKHLVHDENSYAQSIPGAVLNDGSKSHKVEKIVCLSASSVTLDQGSFSNLKLLISSARSWVIQEFDGLCVKLTDALEKETYEGLMARPDMTYKAPTLEELHKNRR
jgi:hypothetical protein